MYEVVKKVSNVQFDIVGRDDMNERLHDEIRIRKLDKFVNLIGYSDNVEQWYNKADIFASLCEEYQHLLWRL